MAKRALVKDLPHSLAFFYKKQQTDEDRKLFLELYNYVTEMQSALDCVLKFDDFDSLIVNEKFISKRDINKFLMSKIPKESVENKPIETFNLLNLDSKILNKINDCLTSSDEIARAKSRMNNLLKDIESLSREIEHKSQSYFSAKKIYETVLIKTNFCDDFVKTIDKIVNSKEFTNVWFDSANMALHAVCSSKFEANNEMFDFGEFDIVINIGKKSSGRNVVNIYPYKNNLANNVMNRFHPHLFEGFNLCWGNATASLTEALSSNDFHRIYILAYLVLNQYNPHATPVNVNHYTIKMSNDHYKSLYNSHHFNDKYYIHHANMHKDIVEMYRTKHFSENSSAA